MKYEYLDRAHNRCVCPITRKFEITTPNHLSYWVDADCAKLEKLGFKLVQEIEIPVELPQKYFLYEYPPDFEVEVDQEGSYYAIHFKKAGKTRVRIITGMLASTAIFTRYYQQRDLIEGQILDVVIDVQESGEGEHDEPKIIWQENPNDNVDIDTWLNTNFPNWEDPTAYWTT